MKKVLFMILIVAFTISTKAKTEKLVGSWLLIRAEMGEEVQEPYFIMDFKDNGKTAAMGMELGTWKFSSSSNSIIMESTFDKDFNGESKIIKLTEKELVVEKNGAKLYYKKINSSAISTNNKSSNLYGTWNIENNNDETIVLKFEETDDFLLVTASEGMTSKERGTWMFSPTDRSIIFVGFSHLLKGRAEIKSISDEELVIEVNGNVLVAKKTKNDNNKIERLTFEYEDFEEESISDLSLPWVDFEKMVSFLTDVEYIKYRSGSLLDELNILKYGTIMSKIEVSSEKQSVMFSNLSIANGDTSQYSQNYKGGLSGRYNDFFPKEEPGPYKITGIEKVTVPAGTFECTVIEGFDDDKIKYWMINDMPGIYAKYIIEGVDMFDDSKYLVYELEEIK